MRRLLDRLSISKRLLIISVTASVPMIAITVYLILTGINKDIDFGRWEKYGNQYQRPLEVLLETVPQHQALAAHALAGDAGARAQLAGKQAQIDQAFAALEAVDAQIGTKLQFTDAGLAQRKREHVRVATVKKEWQELKTKVDSLARAASDEQHAHLVSDIRMMITHAGDTSNLILDPDLDSYYLMDITLLALPQTQDRLAAITALGEGILQRKAITPKERTQLAVSAALLKEADLDRTTGDAQTALNEDANFNGVSESFQKNFPLAVKDYSAATEAFIALLAQIADAEKIEADPSAFVAAGQHAREASFKLWHTGTAELDILLDKRLSQYQHKRTVSLALTALATFASALIVFFIARRTNQALGAIAGQLDEQATRTAHAASQISSSSLSLADGASEQAASLEETSAALEETSSMTKRNAENAQAAKELASQTRAAADSGAADMQAMNDAMAAIKSSNNNIAKIIKTIDEIAFQTNILALNAAVEAARAGEAGLGFAVVADEVRNLAQRSAQAARETAEKIEDSIGKSSQGVQISAKVATGLQEIVIKARQVDELIAEIANASLEQSQGINQINIAVSQMDKITQDNAGVAEESASASSELNVQAGALKQAVVELSQLVGGGKAAATQKQSPDVIHSPAVPQRRVKAATNGHGQAPALRAPTRNGHGSTIPMADDFKDF